MNTSEYLSIIENIKSEIKAAQYRAAVHANVDMLLLYHDIGCVINEHKSWGNKFIDNLATDIRIAFPESKGYSVRNLKYMAKFAEIYPDREFVQTVSAQLSWSHYCELLQVNSIDKINYYIKITEEQNLSVRELRERIKNKEYERLDEETKNKLKNKEELKVPDLVKNPIQIRNTSDYNEISEKVLQKLILEDIPSFLKELGNGFSFIDSEYKIKIGDRYNYIDLLLFNYEFNCFVVVELKVSELKKEHIGQIEFYMNYIDKNLKSINQNKTIGIIICKKENNYIIEYCSDDRILAREYELV